MFINCSKSVIVFTSNCEPGKKAFTTPKSTTIPPFILFVIFPVKTESLSYASLSSCHLFSKSARSLDKINLPFLSSNVIKNTSISLPKVGILLNSFLLITPSDLNPISTITSLSSIATTVPFMTVLSWIFEILLL